jgi:hypothetical protein
MEQYEAVHLSGKRYLVPQDVAYAFATQMRLAEPHNFPRAMDPAHDAHHFAEGWQGAYHVRFLEKIDAADNIIGFELVWGQPRHTMRKYYDHVICRWPELSDVSFESTFCRALAIKPTRKLLGFRVVKLDLESTRARLPQQPLPQVRALGACMRDSVSACSLIALSVPVSCSCIPSSISRSHAQDIGVGDASIFTTTEEPAYSRQVRALGA